MIVRWRRRAGWGAMALLLLTAGSACGGSRPFYDAGDPPFLSPKGFSLHRRAAALGGRTPAHRLILIGDAGAPAAGDGTLTELGRWSADLPDRTTVAFLGDNLYPSGLGEDDERGQKRAAPAAPRDARPEDLRARQPRLGRLAARCREARERGALHRRLRGESGEAVAQGRLPRPGARDPGGPGRRPRAGRPAAGDRPRLVAARRRRAARLRRHRERGGLREGARAHAARACGEPRRGGCAPSAAHRRPARRLGPRLLRAPARASGRRARHRGARPRRQRLPRDARRSCARPSPRSRRSSTRPATITASR